MRTWESQSTRSARVRKPLWYRCIHARARPQVCPTAIAAKSLVPEKLPRGGLGAQVLGRAVVGGRRGSGDDQHWGCWDWLCQAWGEESLLEAGHQLVQQLPGGLHAEA